MDNQTHLFQLGSAVGRIRLQVNYEQAKAYLVLFDTIDPADGGEIPQMIRLSQLDCETFAKELTDLAGKVMAFHSEAVAEKQRQEEEEKQRQEEQRKNSPRLKSTFVPSDLPF